VKTGNQFRNKNKGNVLIRSINSPQAAVLGMHTIKEKPVVVDGQIVIRPIMV
jgi:pyruvate/2-oxoglutarate dehydrogenase complex dihydrolipoamide acyltransferase (E2) component